MLSIKEKAILATVIYFDVFDYPLTCLEIYKYLLFPKGDSAQTTLFEIKHLLETSSLLKKRIQTHQGFYFLQGRETVISTRKKKYIFAEKKFLQARPYLKLLSKIPFVEKIYICNSLSYSNARDESDIDVAIFCKENTIWLARFLAVFLMDIFGQRPDEENVKNKICLSFYLSANNLNLENYQSECPDIHFIYWQSQFLPIYKNCTENFWQSNSWNKKYLPNQICQSTNSRRMIRQTSKIKKHCENIICQSIKNFLNRKSKNYQLKILPTKLKVAAQEPNTNVLLEDNIIKLHSNDKRQEYNQRWRIRYKAIIKYYENITENY